MDNRDVSVTLYASGGEELVTTTLHNLIQVYRKGAPATKGEYIRVSALGGEMVIDVDAPPTGL